VSKQTACFKREGQAVARLGFKQLSSASSFQRLTADSVYNEGRKRRGNLPVGLSSKSFTVASPTPAIKNEEWILRNGVEKVG
jgi:hypothetical protein